MRTGVLAWVVVVAAMAAGAASAADWSPISGQGTVTISNGSLGSAKTATQINDGGASDKTGGLAATVRPSGNITTLQANGLTVSGYRTNITSKAGGSANAFGPFRIAGLLTGVKSIVRTNFASVSMLNNITQFTVDNSHNGTTNAFSIYGGAADFASVGSLSYTNGTLRGNSLSMIVDNVATTGLAHANGGALSIRDQFSANHALTNLRFIGNSAQISGNALGGGALARGGALFVQNTNDESPSASSVDPLNTGTRFSVVNTRFENNYAANTLGGAYGGAAAFDIAVSGSFDRSSFTGNHVNASGDAYGGALYLGIRNSYAAVGSGSSFLGSLSPLGFASLGGGDVYYHTKITNTAFSNNYAHGANAQGGAIWTSSMMYMSGVTFKGNYTTVDGSVRQSNAIHLASAAQGGSGYADLTDAAGRSGVIFADAAGRSSYDYDGISSDDANAVIAKAGKGNLYLYGDYANFKGSMELYDGTTYFKGGQAADVGNGFNSSLVMNRGAKASLALSQDNAGNVAFDTIDLGSGGATVVAKAYGNTASTAGSNHFVASNVVNTSVADGNSYRLVGDLVSGATYYIVENTGSAFSTFTQHSTGAGLYNNYTVYVDDANGSVTAVAGDRVRSLASYARNGNAGSFAGYISSINGGALREYIEANFDASNGDTINHLLTLGAGEGHASIMSSALSYGRAAAANITAMAGEGWSSRFGVEGYSAPAPAPRPIAPRGAYGSPRYPSETAAGVRVWAHWDGFQNTSDSGDASKSRTRGWNFSIGADKLIGDWLLGGGIQYGDNRLKVNNLGMKNEYDAITFAAYAGRRICFNPGTLYLNGGIMGSTMDFESSRHDGLGGRYTADYSGANMALFLDGAFSMRLGRAAEIQPFANLTWNSFWNEDFSETQIGGVGNALRTDSDHHGNLFSTLGLRGKVEFADVVALDGNVGWRHTFGSDSPTAHMGFLGHGGGYSVKGTALDRNELVFGVGVTVRPSRNTSIRVGYDGSVGDDSSSHRGSIDFGISF